MNFSRIFIIIGIFLSTIIFSSSSSYAAVNESPEFGFPEIMILLVLGCLIWGIWGWIKRFRKSSVAEVDNKGASAQTSIEDKLRQLNELKEKNLINDEEYNKKKEKLLEEL